MEKQENKFMKGGFNDIKQQRDFLLSACQWVLDEIKFGHDMIASQAILEQVIQRVNDNE